MRIYPDNCCYNRPYDDQTQTRISLEAQAKLHIQEQIRKKSDYTKWRRTYFGDASVEKINADAIAFVERHPFQPKKSVD